MALTTDALFVGSALLTATEFDDLALAFYAFLARGTLFAPAEPDRLALAIHALLFRGAVGPTCSAVRFRERQVRTDRATLSFAFLATKAAPQLACLTGSTLDATSATIVPICR